MRKIIYTSTLVLSLVALTRCTMKEHQTASSRDYHLGIITAFAEMVAADVKRIALSEPMTPAELDDLFSTASSVAEKYGVNLYREAALPDTDLFPSSAMEGKEVLVICRGTALAEYRQLHEDIRQLKATGNYHAWQREEMSRRFGRLLGYPNTHINNLMAASSEFRTMPDFGIRSTNVFLYFRDLKRAERFYADVLGFELVADHGMAKIFRMTKHSFLTLVDATKGMHTADEPKTVAIALVTENLEAWHDYLKKQPVKFKYEFNYKPNKPHDGFVVEDPEGYLLEFERFNPHRENENFLPGLLNKPAVRVSGKPSPLAPELFIHTTVTWLYYNDMLRQQQFMEDVLGFPLVVDQGWAKVYRVLGSSYIGLVDGRRGMHTATDKKAVNIGFMLDDLDGWYTYTKTHQRFPLWEHGIKTGPTNKHREFVGFDPEGYYLEFDEFQEHPDNQLLVKAMEGQ